MRTQIRIILWRNHINARVADALVQVIRLLVPVILYNITGPKCMHTLL